MKTKQTKENKMTTENKPKLKMTFSYTLDIDFDKLPKDMQAEYNQAKRVYDDFDATIELETFYEGLAEYINEGGYKDFDQMELVSNMQHEVSQEGVKV
jgi:hypothetical protein